MIYLTHDDRNETKKNHSRFKKKRTHIKCTFFYFTMMLFKMLNGNKKTAKMIN